MIAVAHKQGVDPKMLRGTVQNDILKEYIARGTYIFPPAPVDAPHRPTSSPSARAEVPRWNTHQRSAGIISARPAAPPSQEVAFTLANGIAYVRGRARRPGWTSTTSRPGCPSSSTRTTIFFEEIAKFRAARRLWARIMRERFGAQDPKSLHAALPHADGRLHAHGAATGKQRRAGDAAGAGGRARRHAEPAHQLARRGAGVAQPRRR